MLNYWEFEGVSIKKFDAADNKTYLTLEGATETGYPVELCFLVDTKMLNEFGEVPKYSKLSVAGHFETFQKSTETGFMKKKLVRVCDHIIDVKSKR